MTTKRLCISANISTVFLLPLLCVQDEEDIDESLRNSDEYRELLKMKQIRSLKAKEAETGEINHPGYQVSWHCFLILIAYLVKKYKYHLGCQI